MMVYWNINVHPKVIGCLVEMRWIEEMVASIYSCNFQFMPFLIENDEVFL